MLLSEEILKIENALIQAEHINDNLRFDFIRKGIIEPLKDVILNVDRNPKSMDIVERIIRILTETWICCDGIEHINEDMRLGVNKYVSYGLKYLMFQYCNSIEELEEESKWISNGFTTLEYRQVKIEDMLYDLVNILKSNIMCQDKKFIYKTSMKAIPLTFFPECRELISIIVEMGYQVYRLDGSITTEYVLDTMFLENISIMGNKLDLSDDTILKLALIYPPLYDLVALKWIRDAIKDKEYIKHQPPSYLATNSTFAIRASSILYNLLKDTNNRIFIDIILVHSNESWAKSMLEQIKVRAERYCNHSILVNLPSIL